MTTFTLEVMVETFQLVEITLLLIMAEYCTDILPSTLLFWLAWTCNKFCTQNINRTVCVWTLNKVTQNGHVEEDNF